MEKIYISKKKLLKAVCLAAVILLGVVGWQYSESKGKDLVWEETDSETNTQVLNESSIILAEKAVSNENSVTVLGVHVTGAVATPDQVLYLPQGSRVEDAVQAAGGVNEDADLSQLNLADYIYDGQRIYVPTRGEKVENIENTMGENPETLLTNINLATKIELLNLPGIGDTFAERIIAYREENGPFKAIEDIMEVKGIGESKFNDLKDKITVE